MYLQTYSRTLYFSLQIPEINMTGEIEKPWIEKSYQDNGFLDNSDFGLLKNNILSKIEK